MKKLLILALVTLGINQLTAQETISIEAPGNLESPKPLACVSLAEVTNENNPADILTGMGKCIALQEYKNAARLFAIAGVYGRFDIYRVKDKSAHQALLVLQQTILMNLEEKERDALVDVLKKEFEPSSTNLKEICQAIRKIGAPKYYPKYMIQHGISAFTDAQGDGLVENFDSAASWEKALKDYLHCDE